MQPILCPQCGAPLQSRAPQCPYCGVGLENSPTAVGSISQAQNPPVIPPGWTIHKNSWYGFTIAHPPGWHVIPVKGRFSIRKDVGGLVSAWIWPLALPGDALIGDPRTAARQVAEYYIFQLRQSDPSVQAWLAETKDEQPGRLTFRLQRNFMNTPLEGIFTVLLAGASAILSGFECPTGQSGSHADSMRQILASFRTIPAMPKQHVCEPREHAFEVDIPQGWLYQAGVDRNHPGGTGIVQFMAGREQQNLVCLVFPGQIWTFIDSQWGGWSSMPGYQAMPFMPAAQLCQQWIVPGMQQQMHDLAVQEILDRPDLTYQGYLDLAAKGMSTNVDMTTANLTVTYSENGVHLKQRAIVVTSRTRNPYGQGGTWIGFLNVYARAPENEFEQWAPVLDGMAASFTMNPAWQAREQGLVNNYLVQSQRDRSRRLQQISQTLSQTSDMITSSYWSRQETYDRLSHMWSNTILSYQDVTSAGGEVYNVPTGYDRYWVDGLNNIYGGDWNTQPDITWTPLEPTGN